MKKVPFGSLFLLLLLIPMLFRASDVTMGARNGLLLWYNSVVPTLFPFMVLSGLLASGDGISQIMTPFYLFLHPLLRLSKDGCFVLISGLLCGYPLGAKLCAEFFRDGRLSRSEADLLLAICNHASPMFILGYVYPFFSMHITIWELLVCMYAPVLVIAATAGIVCRFHDRYQISKSNSDHIAHMKTPSAALDEVILSSVEILCKIGGYLVLFSILIILIRSLDLISEGMKLFLIGAMEMTTGIRELADLGNWKISFPAAMAALTFGGFSGIFQTRSVLKLSWPMQNDEEEQIPRDAVSERFDDNKKAGLSIRPYIIWKIVHAALSAGLAYYICTIN